MHEIKIAPSLLAADFSRLAEEVRAVRDGGADMLHLDVMDGVFVPNISFGMPVIASLRGVSDLFFDVHIMITEPQRHIEALAAAGAGDYPAQGHRGLGQCGAALSGQP